MALSPGEKLGPYEVVSVIGAGGMGTVYKARDSRLNRTVAIKLLNEQFTERLEREARAIASLNHPNICQIYDVGPNYIVMEYIEGNSLTAPLAVYDALRVAAEICDAVDAAHQKAITHRDLKPGNILLTRSGQVKLLDFGLAKVAASVTENDLTRSLRLTGIGVVVGTLPYMAPEQLEGKEVDHRTDVFALGVLLYELITGKRPFEGDSREILTRTISQQGVAPVQGILLDRVVRKCLAKDPDQRWQSARDLKEALLMSTQAGSTEPSGRSTPLLWPIAAAVFALLAGAIAILHFREVPVEQRIVKLPLLPPENSTFGAVAVSPDGKRLAFTATAAGRTQLWVRPLDSLSAEPLAGSEDSSYPFWSPDSRFIGFFSRGRLMTIEISGGSPQTLSDIAGFPGGAWNKDGVILFNSGESAGLSQLSTRGGEVKPATSLDSSRGQQSHRWPAFLPDGRHFLYTVSASDPKAAGIYLGSFDSKETIRLLGDYSSSAYVSSPSGNGHVLFWRNGTLLAQQCDLARLRLAGEPFLVAEQVGYSRLIGRASFSVSEYGVLVYDAYTEGLLRQLQQLTWFHRSGKRLGTADQPGIHYQPWPSPDGKYMVVDRVDSHTKTSDVWLIDLVRGISSRLTFHPGNDGYPVWSPDGGRIVFASDRDGVSNLYQKIASGAATDEVLLKSANSKWPSGWSRDGRFVLYYELHPKTNWDMWALPLFGDGKPIPVLQTEFNEWRGNMSPDGKWMAYESDESGRYEVYAQPFPPSGDKWRVSRDGGRIPKFRGDGKELYYLGEDGMMMAVQVKAGATFQLGIPAPLFQTRINNEFVRYAVSSDGQRFLIPTPVREAAQFASDGGAQLDRDGKNKLTRLINHECITIHRQSDGGILQPSILNDGQSGHDCGSVPRPNPTATARHIS